MKIENIGILKKIGIEDKEVFIKFFEKYPSSFCDFNLFNLLSWSIIYEYYWTIFKDRLIIYNKTTDYILFPVGERLNIDDIIHISNSFKLSGTNGNFCFVNENYINTYKNDIIKYFNITESKENANYIYYSEKLATLKGRKFHNKRNLISQFTRKYPAFKVNILDKGELNCDLFKKCIVLAEKWVKNKELNIKESSDSKSIITNNNPEDEFDIINEQINNELMVLKNSCNFFKDLNAGLVLIEIDDNIAAFSVYSEQNNDMTTIHFEKFDLKYIGISQAINYFTAKYLSNRYKFINREDDLGIASLRYSKGSYYPDILLIPYNLIRL